VNIPPSALPDATDEEEDSLFAKETDDAPVALLPLTDESQNGGSEVFTTTDWLDVI
jgi:hypothetical protein